MTGRAAFLLSTTIAAAALALSAPAVAAPAGQDRPASIHFEVPGNHGLDAKVGANEGKVTLEIAGRGRLVSYKTGAESTQAGLKARFGRLGEIDVGFRATETSVDEPPPGCRGEPAIGSDGVFTGTIEFTGERHYVRLDATRAKGELWVPADWRCPHHRARPQGEAAPERDVATFSASGRRCHCFLSAFSFAERGRRQSVFVAARLEQREGMEIGRATTAETGASAFVFDHAAGTARLAPPAPFAGVAEYERRAEGPDRWRSTIRVPLLGADPLRFSGPAFRPHLIRDLPGD